MSRRMPYLDCLKGVLINRPGFKIAIGGLYTAFTSIQIYLYNCR